MSLGTVTSWYFGLFLGTLAVILLEKSEIVGEFFLQPWKCNSLDFIEIPGSTCANISLH